MPQIWELGLTVPTQSCVAATTGCGSTREPDWDELKRGHRARPALAGAPRVPRGASSSRSGGCATPRSPHDLRGFRQERKGQPFAHAGSIEAPDAAFADAWAREQYGRRGESEALWLVPRESIHAVTEWADEFDLKYRRVDGYSIKARLQECA